MSASQDSAFMRQALALARQAAAAEEVPVGAVVVLDGAVVGRGYNRMRSLCDPTAHAEILALRSAASQLGRSRLPGSTLYVTVEPCAMCAGALVHARIESLVYGAREPRAGAVVSAFEYLMSSRNNHRVAIREGVLAAQCGAELSRFFAARRKGSAEKS